MATGRRIPPVYEGHSTPARHSMDPLPRDILENTLVSQTAEIDELVTDNHKLASTHVALRHDLAAVREEMEKLKEHIRSTRTESDIQIRIILDKMAKKEGNIQASDSIKKDLQQSLDVAQKLVSTIQELSAKIKHATEELEKARIEAKKLLEMQAELEKLQQEHQRLRNTFEFEKGLNIANVEQMKLMEVDLVSKSTEVERLRTEVLNAERRSQAINSYGQPYMYPTPPPPPVHASMAYMDGYGRPHAQIMGDGAIPYGAAGTAPVGPGIGGAAVLPNSAWGRGPY